jgi:general secretion pathway protein D
VPFLTGSFSSTGSGGNGGVSNPFQTIERQSVGITLRVTPHINEGDSLVMEIEQEVSSLTGAAAGINASDVITNERKIQSKVLADNGQIIVLGGLIKEDVQETAQKVPFLGSIPGLGRLFRSNATSKTKTNLMVFLRPMIVRDGRTLSGATGEKYQYIRDEQLGRIEQGAEFLDPSKLPLLPEWERELEKLRAMEQSRSGAVAAPDSAAQSAEPAATPDSSPLPVTEPTP